MPLPESSDNSIGASDSTPNQTREYHQSQHKRVYQACIPCRRRKVKCDLGSVDNPNDPPCVRCRRECKECYFSATRRKRKFNDDIKENDLHNNSDYDLRNGRKMATVSDSPQVSARQSSIDAPQSATSTSFPVDVPAISGPLTPGGSLGRPRPLRRPGKSSNYIQGSDRSQDSSAQLENLEAQEVMRQELYGPYDALDLLYKAATDSTALKEDQNEHQLPVNFGNRISSPHLPSPTAAKDECQLPQDFRCLLENRQDKTIDPSLASDVPSENPNKVDLTKLPGYDDAIKAWSRFRFVRAGWFTAVEAIEYIEYYYEYMSPLTPISPPTFRDPATHLTLLTEEPFLAVTLLSIATRYRQIPNSGGYCRSHAIHEQLWNYLRGMIERCLWGQEAVGGRFYSSVTETDPQISSGGPGRRLRKGSLRALGTIESLMVLTEWHPRALHFPPVDVTDELMIPSYDSTDNHITDDEANSKLHRTTCGVGGKRIESWLEPAWRSDRMCWMLLSTAMGLSYELGVFDNMETLFATGGEISRPEYDEEAYRMRASRIKRLLLIYVTQLAGRLGWTNMVPENLRATDPSFAPQKRRNTQETRTSMDTYNRESDSFNYVPDLELDDQVIHCWAGITNVMRLANEVLFKSRQYTTNIIQDGSYVEILQDFQPMLREWKVEFELFRLPPYIRHVLTIEYEYTRIYINSLSLQAVVERCSNHAGLRTGAPGNFGISISRATLSPAVINYYGKLPLARLGGISAADQDYVREVIDGSRNLLRTVVEGLLPNDYLKHAPVRTYFRIISGAMFLLKTFALGAPKSDVEISIRLMDRAVYALRNCIVDDVHLGIRFADLLETLTSRLRCRFISATADPAHYDNLGRTYCSVQQDSHEKRTKTDVHYSNELNITTPNVSCNDTNNNNDSSVSAMHFGSNPAGLSFLTSTTPFNQSSDFCSYSTSDTVPETFTSTTDWGTGNEVWYLPPGMAFFQNINDQAVAQTSEGVNVGGIDLLDFMALDPLEPFENMSTF